MTEHQPVMALWQIVAIAILPIPIGGYLATLGGIGDNYIPMLIFGVHCVSLILIVVLIFYTITPEELKLQEALELRRQITETIANASCNDLKGLVGQYPDYKEKISVEIVTRCLE